MDRCLIVIDFNGTILKRVKQMNNERFQEFLSRDNNKDLEWFNGNKGEKIVIRPGSRKFADFLHSKAIDYWFWTSAVQKNALKLYEICQLIGFNNAQYLLTQEDCLIAGSIVKDGRRRPKFIKNLSGLWADGYYHPENVILIDDSDYKVTRDQLKNFLRIKEFDPTDHQSWNPKKDDLLPLIVYLETMIQAVKERRKTCVQFMRETKFEDFCTQYWNTSEPDRSSILAARQNRITRFNL